MQCEYGGVQSLPSAGVDVEIRHLRYFVAVAEEASFTSAARRVHVAQQVLSAQIRQLEMALGVELLNRGARGVTLTPGGAAFLDRARDTLRALDRSAAAARNAAGAVTGRLAVGLSVAAGGERPTYVLAEFQRTHAHVEVILRTFELTHPAAGLLDHSSDVAFVRPPVAAPGVSVRTVAEEPRVFVLPAGHRLAGCDRLTLTDVAGLSWVAADVATDGCDPTAWRDDWLVNPRPGGDVPIIGAVARTIDEWREHVAAGRGISLCPASAETYYARPELAFVPGDGTPVAELCVAWRAGDENPVVAAFLEMAAGVRLGAAT
jgi:DNA-binding transcriptional LysR family regulator